MLESTVGGSIIGGGMDILPLVARELNVALRRPSTKRLQLGFGGGTMLAVFWGFLVWMGPSSTAAQTVFQGLTFFALAGIWLVSVFGVSDTISKERREGTIGFLFLTDLDAREVILGKLAAAALVPGYTLLAMFPGLALCAVAGSLTAGQFWRTIVALVVALGFALVVSVYVSTKCFRQRSAQGFAGLVLLVLNPVVICFAATSWVYDRWPGPYWISLGLFGAMGSGALVLSCRNLERSWREQEEISKPVDVPALSYSSSKTRIEPVTWMMLRRIRSARARWRFAIPVVAMMLVLWLAPAGGMIPWLVAVLFFSQLVLSFLNLAQTAHSFHQDRQDGSLELLLGTKLAAAEVFEGFYRAMLHRTRATLWTFTAAAVIVAGLCWVTGSKTAAVFPLAMAATLWITCFSMGWVGVFRSLMTHLPLVGMLSAFARVTLFPMLITVILLLAGRVEVAKVLMFWVCATAFVGAFFAMDAKAALAKHGRELLLRPQAEKPPHIENEWSFINWEDEVGTGKLRMQETVL